MLAEISFLAHRSRKTSAQNNIIDSDVFQIDSLDKRGMSK